LYIQIYFDPTDSLVLTDIDINIVDIISRMQYRSRFEELDSIFNLPFEAMKQSGERASKFRYLLEDRISLICTSCLTCLSLEFWSCLDSMPGKCMHVVLCPLGNSIHRLLMDLIIGYSSWWFLRPLSKRVEGKGKSSMPGILIVSNSLKYQRKWKRWS